MVYGGLLGRRCVGPWFEALNGGKVRLGKEWLWLEMIADSFSGRSIPWKRSGLPLTKDAKKALRALKEVQSERGVKPPKMILRRWFADPLTEILILRLLSRANKAGAVEKEDTTPEDCLWAFLRHLDVDPVALRDIQAWAETRARLVAPSFLVEYAACRTPSVSLPASTWARIRLGEPVPVSGKTNDEAPPVRPRVQKGPVAGGRFNAASQRDLLEEVMRILRPKEPSDKTTRKPRSNRCRADIEALGKSSSPPLSPALYYLVCWAVDLLQVSENYKDLHRKPAALRPISVYRYLRPIAEALIENAAGEDICRMPALDLEELYRDTVEEKTSVGERIYAADRLDAFHRFLRWTFAAPPVDFSEIAGNRPGSEHNVDSNLVSYRDFRNLLSVLDDRSTGEERSREISALIAILGFRCGLRRSEALHIRLGDVLGQADPALIVRSSSYATTKSAASNRIIPLGSLMPDSDLERLRLWVQRRVGEDKGRDPKHFLFCPPTRLEVPLSAGVVFNPITRALHQVTGDKTLSFHHLRHSFVTLLLFRLLQPNDPSPSPARGAQSWHLIADAPLTRADPAALLGQKTGRRIPYAVSTLAGHAQPAITMLSYMHLNDLALAMALSTPAAQPHLSHKAIETLTRIVRKRIGKLQQDSGRRKGQPWLIAPCLGTVRNRYRNKLNLVEPLDQMTVKLDLTPLPAEPRRFPSWSVVNTILAELEQSVGPARREAISRLEALSDVPAPLIEQWDEGATRLRGMTTRREYPRRANKPPGAKMPRHAKDNELLFSKARLQPADRKLVERIFDEVASMPDASRESLHWGMRRVLASHNRNAANTRFADVNDGKNFLEFLQKLKIDCEEIFADHYPKRGQSGTASAQRQWWANELNLPLAQIRPRGKWSDTSRNPMGSIGFKVAPARADETRKGRQKSPRTPKAAFGFRYAIYLLSVVLDLDPKGAAKP